MVQDRLTAPFRALGSQRVKNINRSIRIWQWVPDAPPPEDTVKRAEISQRVQFCMAPDGTQLAYASVGQGPALLKAPNWLNHIEYEWRSPVWGPAFAQMAKRFHFVRFDQRGNGLSDWEVEEISEDAMISDMEVVVSASQLDRFLLFGISQGCAFSIRYAAKNPGRVKGLILLGGYVRGALARKSEDQKDLHEATTKMILRGWGSPNPLYRHFFTEGLMPDASPEQKSSFDELQRLSITPENAVRINTMNAHVDVSELARQVKVPTLVVHCTDDQRAPLEEGRRMAALIPGARFIALEGNNHALIEGTPAFDKFFEALDEFVSEHGLASA
jgi:pimeloyl-ACP methyl ester carboxylesterase